MVDKIIKKDDVVYSDNLVFKYMLNEKGRIDAFMKGVNSAMNQEVTLHLTENDLTILFCKHLITVDETGKIAWTDNIKCKKSVDSQGNYCDFWTFSEVMNPMDMLDYIYRENNA